MSSRRLLSVTVFAALMALRCSGDDEANAGDGDVQGLAGSAGASAAASGAGGMGRGGAAGTGMAAGGAAGDMPASGMGELAMVSFESDVWPVLRENCAGAGCHGEGSFLVEHANSDVDVAFDEAAPFAEAIAGRVSVELTPIMPQGCGPAPGFGMCLSLDEVALIRAWVEQGAPF
jgi:hypothetical protein